MQEVRFALQYAKADNKLNTSETALNLYAEKQPDSALSTIILKNTPGYSLVTQTGTYNILGMYATPDKLFIVTATALYSYDGTALTLLGSLNLSGNVTFGYNGTHLVITSGDSYYYDGSTVQQITDPAYYPSDTVTYQDGYFIFNRRGTGQFFISDLYSISFNPLMYATAESSPDNLLAVKSDSKKLWLFGSDTIEVWYDSGDVFPFDRMQGGIINTGLLDSNTIQLVNNVITFVGTDNVVYILDGFSPVRISTTAIENIIANSDYFNSTYYTYDGHWFYILHLTGTTLVYDFQTGVWHKRQSDTGRWGIEYTVNFNTKVYGADLNLNLFELSEDVYTANGTPIKREIITTPIFNNAEYFTLDSFQLYMEAGEVPYTDDNNIYLQFSDNGQDWSNIKETTLGQTGERDKRIKWNRLGRHREVMMKVYTYAQVSFRIMKAFANFRS